MRKLRSREVKYLVEDQTQLCWTPKTGHLAKLLRTVSGGFKSSLLVLIFKESVCYISPEFLDICFTS